VLVPTVNWIKRDSRNWWSSGRRQVFVSAPSNRESHLPGHRGLAHRQL